MARHLTAALRMLATLRRNRFLVKQLARRSFASQHVGSLLGWLWTPLSTVVQFALFMIVFSYILQIKLGAHGTDVARGAPVGFGVFLITGLVPFLALNDAVVRGARVFRSNTSLVQRVRLPAEVLVLGDLAGAMLHHLAALALVVGLCAFKGHLVAANLGWALGGFVLLGIWVLGLSLMASVIGVFLPDLSQVLTMVMQVVFYGAPIVYPLSYVHNDLLRFVVGLNPLTSLVEVVRAGLIGTPAPPAFAVVTTAVIGGLLVVLGAAALDRWRHRFADLL